MLAVLADGMGGHAGGDVASETACSVFISACRRKRDGVTQRLLHGLTMANQAIAKVADFDPDLTGMGCTLVGVAFTAGAVHWISVGDSPLYLYRGGVLQVLNEDHSMAPLLDAMAARGEMSADEARNDGRRNLLRSAVSGREIELIDCPMQPLALQPGDYVVVASDGVQTLQAFEISRLIGASADEGPMSVAQSLVDAVEGAGHPHQDNTTIIAIRFSGKPAE